MVFTISLDDEINQLPAYPERTDFGSEGNLGSHRGWQEDNSQQPQVVHEDPCDTIARRGVSARWKKAAEMRVMIRAKGASRCWTNAAPLLLSRPE